jgi:hypothetical protein
MISEPEVAPGQLKKVFANCSSRSFVKKRNRFTGEVDEREPVDFKLPVRLGVFGHFSRWAERDGDLLPSQDPPACCGDGVLKPTCSETMVRRYSSGEEFWCCPRSPYCKSTLHDGRDPAGFFDFELPSEWIAEQEADVKASEQPTEAKAEEVETVAPKAEEVETTAPTKQSKKPPKFRILSQSKYPDPQMRKDMIVPDSECPVCNCSPDNGGCGDDCMNRIVFMECVSEFCPCARQSGVPCANTAIQNARFPPIEVFLTSNGCGWALRTVKAVRAGTMLCEYTGEVITDSECKLRHEAKAAKGETDVYFAALGGDLILDAQVH